MPLNVLCFRALVLLVASFRVVLLLAVEPEVCIHTLRESTFRCVWHSDTRTRTWFTHSSTIFEHQFLAAVFSIFLAFQTTDSSTCASYGMSIGMINLCEWIFDLLGGGIISVHLCAQLLDKVHIVGAAVSIIAEKKYTLHTGFSVICVCLRFPRQCALIPIIKYRCSFSDHTEKSSKKINPFEWSRRTKWERKKICVFDWM